MECKLCWVFYCFRSYHSITSVAVSAIILLSLRLNLKLIAKSSTVNVRGIFVEESWFLFLWPFQFLVSCHENVSIKLHSQQIHDASQPPNQSSFFLCNVGLPCLVGGLFPFLFLLTPAAHSSLPLPSLLRSSYLSSSNKTSSSGSP